MLILLKISLPLLLFDRCFDRYPEAFMSGLEVFVIPRLLGLTYNNKIFTI